MPGVNETKTFPFKIGADPEILLFYGDKHINAGNAIPKFFEGKYPKGNMGYTIGGYGNFGWDGSSPTGEIRPKESEDINVLTQNIGELFKAAHNAMPLFDMSTLSIGRPVGGHFHVDAPAAFMDTKVQTKIRKILAVLLLPITASEHKLSSTQRTKGSGYGDVADVRIHNESNMRTYELRGPSSEWLISEKICKSTLAYIGVIWNEILKNHNVLLKNDIVFKNLTQASAVQSMVISDYKPFSSSMTELIGREVKKFELYPKFKEEVDFILNTQAVYKEKEAAGWNINNGWNLKNNKPTTKRDLLAKNKIKEKIKAMNIEQLQNTFKVSYNDDHNVAIFASGIAERVAATNWTLTHEYFLFGLKKETKGFLAAPAIQFTKSDGKRICYAIPENISAADSATTLKNMANRVGNSVGRSIKISPKTGKAFAGVSNTILVGIPYDIRAEENIKPLIDIMWDIENGKLKTKPIEEFTVNPVSNKDEPKDPHDELPSLAREQEGLSDDAQQLATEQIMNDYQQVEEVIPAEADEETTQECYNCGGRHDSTDCDND